MGERPAYRREAVPERSHSVANRYAVAALCDLSGNHATGQHRQGPTGTRSADATGGRDDPAPAAWASGRHTEERPCPRGHIRSPTGMPWPRFVTYRATTRPHNTGKGQPGTDQVNRRNRLPRRPGTSSMGERPAYRREAVPERSHSVANRYAVAALCDLSGHHSTGQHGQGPTGGSRQPRQPAYRLRNRRTGQPANRHTGQPTRAQASPR